MLETCPFCGKSFKRLKTHLPHCKYAPVAQATQASKNPITASHQQNHPSPVNTSSIPSLALLETANANKRSSGKKSAKKTEKPSPPPSSASSSPTKKSKKTLESSSPAALPSLPTTQKKKHRIVDDIKPVPLPLLSINPPITKPKKKGVRAPKEYSDSGSKTLLGTEAASTGLLLSPEPSLAPDLVSCTSPVSHGDTGRPVTSSKLKMTENTGSTKSALDPGPVRLQPKDAAKKKPQRQKAGLAVEATPPSVSQGPGQQGLMDGGLQGPSCGDGAWAEGAEVERNRGSSGREVEKMERLHWSGVDQIRPVLQDHTILSNLNTESQKSILDQIKSTTAVQSANHLFNMIDSRRPVRDLSESSALRPVNVPVLPASTPVPRTRTGNKTIMTSLPSSLTRSPGLLNTSHTRDTPPVVWSSTVPPRPAPVVMDIAQSLRQGMELKTKAQQLAEQEALGAVTQRALGEVTLRQLPGWLADQLPNHPREAAHMLHRGWQWYYRRYIDVKKGGVGGVAMLLAGYCVLSYTWNYPHIKRDRWRRYH
ncbi:uncharacterized protein C17orf80 homolog isoform X2 [Hypomesus transpacificus]|uniref:uncharacterized protein C17orf80 homolog isoform X2 n=1 Tax=Hypomesus transpacificus TaxID=137520 RepID=UPI001F072877|nr:uncharacterized protein C17orf80 homolog isoform X2 [Hypomesus transpacificus]